MKKAMQVLIFIVVLAIYLNIGYSVATYFCISDSPSPIFERVIFVIFALFWPLVLLFAVFVWLGHWFSRFVVFFFKMIFLGGIYKLIFGTP